MVTAAELRTSAVTINALMEGFERTYLEYLEEVGTKEDSERTKKRYRAVCAFYHIRDLLDKFADDLEKCTLGVIESGRMTKDLALITDLKDVKVLNSQEFIVEIRKELEKIYC